MTASASHRGATRVGVLLATALLGLTAAAAPPTPPNTAGGDLITGPYAHLLAASENLGPSRAGDVQLTVTLPSAERPDALMDWAVARGLAVRWEPDNAWAIVTGPADHVTAAFDVPVHDFRGRQGQRFYASPLQPALPLALRGEVTEVGRILSYLPHRMARPVLPRDVPRPGLRPTDLLRAYNATPLAEAGYTGKGQT
ncbi:MAG: protease pro-enzyme activation domain-containing protein, partial [Mycobacterium sp.]